MPRFDNEHEAKSHLLEALVIGSSDGLIEAAEARGQQSLVNSQDLPLDMGDVSREQLEIEWGVIFGEDINELFVSCVLPDGWKKVATDHSMWSEILDTKGRRRAAIFYKAAFYDRKGALTIEPFYSVASDYDAKTERVVNADGDTVKEFTYSGNFSNDEAYDWLCENYPDHRSPFFYWT